MDSHSDFKDIVGSILTFVEGNFDNLMAKSYNVIYRGFKVPTNL